MIMGFLRPVAYLILALQKWCSFSLALLPVCVLRANWTHLQHKPRECNQEGKFSDGQRNNYILKTNYIHIYMCTLYLQSPAIKFIVETLKESKQFRQVNNETKNPDISVSGLSLTVSSTTVWGKSLSISRPHFICKMKDMRYMIFKFPSSSETLWIKNK